MLIKKRQVIRPCQSTQKLKLKTVRTAVLSKIIPNNPLKTILRTCTVFQISKNWPNSKNWRTVFRARKTGTSQVPTVSPFKKMANKWNRTTAKNFIIYFFFGKSMNILDLFFVLNNILQRLSNKSHLFLSYDIKKVPSIRDSIKLLKDKIKQ